MNVEADGSRCVFTINDFILQSGIQLHQLNLVYTCHGTLDSQGGNAILFPTYFMGTDEDNARLIGRGRALDSSRYCIIVPNLIGNGVSSSPHTMSAPFDGPRFPLVSVYDNVRAQALLLDALGIDRIQLIVGWSMGGIQAYQWCAQYPMRVARALIICGSARTALHNRVFIDGVRSALKADTRFLAGDYTEPPQEGLKAFARVYAGWAYSQAFFRHARFRELGHASVEALMQAWEADHLCWDANDLLSMLATWECADISNQAPFHGDLSMALRSIEAQVWLMPCEQDLYFRHEDNREELEHLRFGHYCGFESEFGHCAAGPGRFALETAGIEMAITRLLTCIRAPA